MGRSWGNTSYPVVLVSLSHTETVAEENRAHHPHSYPDLLGDITQLDVVLLCRHNALSRQPGI